MSQLPTGSYSYKMAAIYRIQQEKLQTERRIQREVNRDVDAQIDATLREILSNTQNRLKKAKALYRRPTNE